MEGEHPNPTFHELQLFLIERLIWIAEACNSSIERTLILITNDGTLPHY
jgi:hypothetical protein